MPGATYVRVYADETGESHFEDLALELVPVDFAPPADPLNTADFLPTSQSFWLGIPVGWNGEAPHPTPRRQILCVLQGVFEISTSDGDVRRLPVGSVFLLEDTAGAGHAASVVGDQDVLLFGAVVAAS